MSKPSDELTCDKCGETASGPSAAEVMARHMVKKHPAKAVKNAGS